MEWAQYRNLKNSNTEDIRIKDPLNKEEATVRNVEAEARVHGGKVQEGGESHTVGGFSKISPERLPCASQCESHQWSHQK